jgi:hypothetical protein
VLTTAWSCIFTGYSFVLIRTDVCNYYGNRVFISQLDTVSAVRHRATRKWSVRRCGNTVTCDVGGERVKSRCAALFTYLHTHLLSKDMHKLSVRHHFQSLYDWCVNNELECLWIVVDFISSVSLYRRMQQSAADLRASRYNSDVYIDCWVNHYYVDKVNASSRVTVLV